MTEKIPEFPKFDSFPEHRKLTERILALRVKRDAVNAKLRQALAGSQALQDARTGRQDAARKLLEGDGKLPDRLAPGQIEAGEADRLRTELVLLDAAIALGERELGDLESKLSRKCVEPLKDHHRKVVEQMARQAVELFMLARKEERIYDALREAGISGCGLTPSGGPARPLWMGTLRTNLIDAGNVAVWIRSLIEEGLLNGRLAWVQDFLNLDADPVPRPQPVRPEEPKPTRKKRAFYL